MRWIERGPVDAAAIARFGAPHDAVEDRVDRYLVTATKGLAVKLRGDVQLDAKTATGPPGEIELPGAHGWLERWDRWTFPVPPPALPPPDAPGWIALRKIRRRRSFRIDGATLVERSLSDPEGEGCTAELTDFTVDGESWRSFGLEASGDPAGAIEGLGSVLTALLERRAAPLALTIETSMSYAAWLAGRTAPRPEP